MLEGDLDILLKNADQGEIKIISELIRERTLLSMLATKPVTLQNIVEAKCYGRQEQI